VCDLAKREAACCPFLSYEIVEEDEKIVWTTTGLGASDIAVLDEFLDSESVAASSEAIAERLGDQRFPVIGPILPDRRERDAANHHVEHDLR
jgi:hypothetical protein